MAVVSACEKLWKPAVVAALFGDLVEAALGFLDLRARRQVDRRIVGGVDHVLADADEIAAHREVVDRAAVILGVDDGRRLGGEAREVLRHGQAAEIVFAQERLQRDRRGDLAGANELRGDLEDAAMQLFVEMLGSQEVRDAIKCVVVDENRAQQGLFGLDVVRGQRYVGCSDGSAGWNRATASNVAMGDSRRLAYGSTSPKRRARCLLTGSMRPGAAPSRYPPFEQRGPLDAPLSQRRLPDAADAGLPSRPVAASTEKGPDGAGRFHFQQ